MRLYLNYVFFYVLIFVILYSAASYRFIDLFPDAEIIRDIQKELDALIEAGIIRLTTLLLNSDARKSDVLET